MSRIKHFARNAGVWGCVWVVLMTFLLLGIAGQESLEGVGIYVPVFLLLFAVTYWVRNWLVEHYRTVYTMMNRIAIGLGIIVLVVLRSDFFGPHWLGALVAAFGGAYVGCYFWLLSDSRIVIRRS